MRIEIGEIEVTAQIIPDRPEERVPDHTRLLEELRREIREICADVVQTELRRRSER